MTDETGRDQIDDALKPPTRIDPTTGLPYGWDEDDELAGWEGLPLVQEG